MNESRKFFFFPSNNERMSAQTDLGKTADSWCGACSLKRSFLETRVGTSLLWFLIIFVITFVIFYIVMPDMVKERDNNGDIIAHVDLIRLLYVSLFAGLIAGIIGFLVRSKCNCSE